MKTINTLSNEILPYPVQSLDPATLPFRGELLIEASAGTGKTFTIALLYLRLLLGLGHDNAYRRPLSVDEILVVTFTDAACQELRGRIRENIHQLRILCLRYASSPMPSPQDPAISAALCALIEQISDYKQAAAWLLIAEQQMDDSAIYTIHGFCQRMLNINAFESGVQFELHLLDDESPVLRQAAEDFWRRYCYPLPEPVVRQVLQSFHSPQHLLLTLRPWLQVDSPQVSPVSTGKTIAQTHTDNIEKINQLKRHWLQVEAELASIIQTSSVDKRSYSRRNLPQWLSAVTVWAQQPTEDYQLPKELIKFSATELRNKTQTGEPPSHGIFDHITEFYRQPISLYAVIVSQALKEIRRSARQEKQRQAQLGFDDLLGYLDKALQSPQAEHLVNAIRQRYPVAMIDEFQDTDPLQYRIFQTIYAEQTDCALLLIGDPKQAIYAFRGADIFTYIAARNAIHSRYSLGTNWRSSSGMVNAVNALFNRLPHPFLFADIPFHAVNASPHKQGWQIIRSEQPQKALRIWLQPGEGASMSDYKHYMAQHCARDIAQWLIEGQQGQAYFVQGQLKKPVTAADITVLVRSRSEATLIRQALLAQGIASVYLSGRDSVYQTAEASELLWLLQAILAPRQQHLVRTALATSWLGFDAAQIDRFSQDSKQWDRLTEQFNGWQQQWYRQGILATLRQIIVQQQLAENLLVTEGGERRITDIMHLAELLQEASTRLENPHALVRYLVQQIEQPNENLSAQQMRLESDRHLVQVVTIHKSKGLQYPLVWLPFIAAFRPANDHLYHDRQSYRTILDLSQDPTSLEMAEQERLAEDLRLLYVALTRSIWHCSLGIAPLFSKKRKLTGETDLHLSAIGYLLQQAKPATADQLLQYLQTFCQQDCDLVGQIEQQNLKFQSESGEQCQLSSRQLSRQLNHDWRVTSYSGLTRHDHPILQAMQPGFAIETADEIVEPANTQLSVHQFPKGASAGTFLHGLLEQIDFSQPLCPRWVEAQLLAQGYQPQWGECLYLWLQAIIQTPLPGIAMPLASLTAKDRLIEMAFYLPIDHPLIASRLQAMTRRYDPLSRRAAALDFKQVQGMLKGFIDLVFCWQGRFYIVDYKSNWLGADKSAYTEEAISQAMAAHHYDLQYQLYSLALHRYLQIRLAEYDYQQHFGGVYYLFLRGMASGETGAGVYFTRPDQAMIETLDQLFKGELHDDSAI